MNFAILPKEIQEIINEYNIEHRPRMKMVMKELLQTIHDKIDVENQCTYCGDISYPEFTTYIMWHKFTFCSMWCACNGEDEIRRNYRLRFSL